MLELKRERTRAEQQAMFANLNAGRSQGAINKDLSLRAAETLPNTPENVKLWAQNPRRIDIEGIDTPRTNDLPKKSTEKAQSSNIISRDEFYDQEYWYDPKRGKHPASGSGRLPLKEVPFYERTHYDTWRVVNPYTRDEKLFKTFEEAKKHYDGLYDEYVINSSNTKIDKLEHGRMEGTKYKQPSNVYDSPFVDLTHIWDGVWHGQNVSKEVANDASKLYDAIDENDIKTIMGIEKKYEKAYLTTKKAGQTRDRYIRTNPAKTRIFKLAILASEKIQPHKKSAPSKPDNKESTTPKTSEFEADANLINKTIAMRAHQGTSWKPDERGKMEIEGFENEVNRIYKELSKHAKSPEQKSILKREIEEFQRDYASKENQRLSKHSSIYSTMIAGRSNFNSKQASKRSDSYDKTAREVTEWKSKAIGRISKKLQKQGIRDEGGEIQVMRNKLDIAEKKQAAMKLINKVRKSKKLSDDEKVDKIIKETGFKKATATNAINAEFSGFEPYMLTNNNANIKRMKDRIATMEAMDAKPTTSETVNGVEIVDSSEDDRVQLFFDGKPDDTMRDKLKGSGWRWAPSVGAWQRKRTDAAIQSAKQILKGD